MPIDRHGLDPHTLDGVLSLDLDRGSATVDLGRAGFVDAYALTALACFIASAARDGLPVELVLPEDLDVRSWLSRMHLGDVLEAFGARVEGVLPRVAERDRRDALIELQRFEDSHGADRLAAFIWDRLEGGADGRSSTSCSRPRASWARTSSSTPAPWPAGSSRPALQVRDARRPGHPASGPVERVPHRRRGPGPRAPRGRRGSPGPRRHRLDPQRRGLPDDRPRPGDVGRRVPAARYDCRGQGALPTRQVTRWSGDEGHHVDTDRPKLVSSRHQARELTAELTGDLSDTAVMVDCSALQASTPSFVDELVKAVLVDRGGHRLVLKGAPDRTVELARRAAQNRGVLDRLEIG